MLKNKFYKFAVFTTLLLVFSFVHVSFTRAEATNSLPDNVKITTSPDGSSTTVIVNAKPGFTTNVQTNCVNGKCTHTTTSKAITSADIQKMKDNMKLQQEEMNKLWKMQEEMFKQQQKMFQDIWGINWF